MAFSRTVAHATASDATFSAAGAAAWDGTGAHSPAVSGATVGGIPYCPTETTETTSANFLYTETSGPRLQVGSGGSTSSGWVIGYRSSGVSAMWSTGLTPSTTNYALAQGASGNTILNSPIGQPLYMAIDAASGNYPYMALGPTAGLGLAITAGTAASAVSALAISQTWNYNSAAINAVDWTFTDTSSHASTNAFRIRGGAAGATALFNVTKAGQANAVSYAVGGVAGASFGPGAVASITVVNGIITAIS